MTDMQNLKKMLEGAIEEMAKTTHKNVLPKLSEGTATLVVRDEGEMWFYFDTDGKLQSVRVYTD